MAINEVSANGGLSFQVLHLVCNYDCNVIAMLAKNGDTMGWTMGWAMGWGVWASKYLAKLLQVLDSSSQLGLCSSLCLVKQQQQQQHQQQPPHALDGATSCNTKTPS